METVPSTAPAAPTGPAPRRRPDLVHLDEQDRAAVEAAVALMRERVGWWGERFLHLVRAHVPGYDVLADEEVRDGASALLLAEVDELTHLRLPDEVLRARLETMARRRAGLGLSPQTLTEGYRLGSRELLVMMDAIAAEVGLPADLLLAVHDSTWEFANEAAAVFARVHRDLSVQAAHLEAERRSAFARAVLSGSAAGAGLLQQARALGVDPRAQHVAMAVRSPSQAAVEAVRRAVAVLDTDAARRLTFADLGSCLGLLSPLAPRQVTGHLVAVGVPAPLEDLAAGFEDVLLALDSAERFALDGVVRLADLGPAPLVLGAPRVAAVLEERHLSWMTGPFGAEVEATVRAYLAADQRVEDVARALTVHPNTVRYRLRRFQESSGLDLRRTTDLVTAWWLLNRRGAGGAAQPLGPPAT